MVADKTRIAPGRVFGPASLIGVVAGIVVQATVPFWVPREFGWTALALPFVSGLVCCLFSGRVRHLGAGLVVSMATLPLAILAMWTAGAILHVMRY
ncbi:hypothetical protein ACWDUD_17075 [Rhodococcus sp. NPDC003382]